MTRPCGKHRRPSPQGRHRRLTDATGRHRAETRTDRWRSDTADRWRAYRGACARVLSGPQLRTRRGSVAAVLLLLLGLTPVAVSGSVGDRPDDGTVAAIETTTPAAQLAERGAAAESASRSLPRDGGDAADTSEVLQALPEAYAAVGPQASPEASGEDGEEEDGSDEGGGDDGASEDGEPQAAQAAAEAPEPIGGLNERQMAHAATIVEVGQKMDMPKEAWVVALATAMQESNMRVLANPNHPESFDVPNDGEGQDHDSVGIFQQRPASGWGSVEELMDPATSAEKFYHALDDVSGWDGMAVTEAAQAVQVSAFPDHYAKHEPLARKLVDALT